MTQIDDSIKYIKMMEKAVEIWSMWYYEPGNFVADNLMNKRVWPVESISVEHINKEIELRNRYIPILSIRQLLNGLKNIRKMDPSSVTSFVSEKVHMDFRCAEENEIACERCRKDALYWRSFPSWEQFLLAYVYEEKYNKRWDDDKEDWVVMEGRDE